MYHVNGGLLSEKKRGYMLNTHQNNNKFENIANKDHTDGVDFLKQLRGEHEGKARAVEMQKSATKLKKGTGHDVHLVTKIDLGGSRGKGKARDEKGRAVHEKPFGLHEFDD